jgi:MHS family proline/betaine transporter-like MFS transporter
LEVDDITVVKRSVLRQAVIGTVVGNLMEWYDVGVYGYLAVTIGQVFLSDAPATVQRLFSLSVFAITFIARPLGGLFLGSLGDRLGRQKVLSFTLLAMSGATFLIGVLPDFSHVGIWAPLALILLKLVQGFSTGGEYAGATTLITEYSPDRHRGFYSSLLDVGSYLGFALGATMVSLMEAGTSESAMLSWGWRLPFIAALPLALVAIYFRNRVDDTPAFQQAQAKAAEQERTGTADSHDGKHSNSIVILLRRYGKELLVGFALVAAGNTLGYTLTTYMPTYLTTTLHYDAAHGNLITIPVLVVLAALIPVAGALSDRFGRRRMLAIGSGSAAILVIPAFLLMASGSLVETFFGLFLLALPTACMISNIAATLPALFPTSLRYSGMGISYNFAAALLAGTAPLIMEALVTATGNSLAPAFWIVATSLCGVVAVIFLRETARKPMPGAMPTVASHAEARKLVENQDTDPDINVVAIRKLVQEDKRIRELAQ